MQAQVIVLIMLLLGGGVSVAAEGALPGSPLHGMKVGVNEEVRSAFTLSAEGKANWDVRRAERRLEEVEKVATKGDLQADVRSSQEDRLKKHVIRAMSRLDELETSGKLVAAADVASRLEASLGAHSMILNNMTASAGSEAERTESLKLEQTVDSEHNVAAGRRAELEAKLSAQGGAEVKTAAEGKLTAAENKIREARSRLQKMKSRLDAEVTAQAEARLAAADVIVAEGKSKLAATAYGEAFMLFSKAHRMAQDAQLLMNASSDLKLKLNIPTMKVELKSEVMEAGSGIEGGTQPGTNTNANANGNANVNAGANVNAKVNVNANTNMKVNTDLDGAMQY